MGINRAKRKLPDERALVQRIERAGDEEHVAAARLWELGEQLERARERGAVSPDLRREHHAAAEVWRAAERRVRAALRELGRVQFARTRRPSGGCVAVARAPRARRAHRTTRVDRDDGSGGEDADPPSAARARASDGGADA